MAKRSSVQRSSSTLQTAQPARWRRLLLLLTFVPMVGGILLVLAALFGISIWGSSFQQAILGVFYILAGFAASNALQQLWLPAGGWLLLGIAAWLFLNRPEAWARYLAIGCGAVGVLLLSGEFLKRFWERQGQANK